MNKQEKFGDLLRSLCLEPTGLTVVEFSNLIQIGERQIYRWLKNESIPKRSQINRIAVLISRELDKKKGDKTKNPFPQSDRIDYFLENLLISAGYSPSPSNFTKTVDVVWEEINKNKTWKLAYMNIPPHAIAPKSDDSYDKPQGQAIEYAEEIGRLLGLKTEWIFIKEWDEVKNKVWTREVDGVAPFLMEIPSRFFDYNFALATKQGVGIKGVVPTQLIEENSIKKNKIDQKHVEEELDLSFFPPDLVEPIYINKEVGNWGYECLRDKYKKPLSRNSLNEVEDFFASKIRQIKNQVHNESIPIFLTDSITCGWLVKESTLSSDLSMITIEDIDKYSFQDSNNKSSTNEKEIINFKLGFAFHPEEYKLTKAVEKTIDIFGAYDAWIQDKKKSNK